MDKEEKRRRLYQILEAVESTLGQIDPLPTVATVTEFIEVGELALALDTICTQLYEYDIPVTPAVLDEIATIGPTLGLEESLWRDLRSE